MITSAAMSQSPRTSPIRVRFAPSPTGYLHVGGVRALLFNWLYARGRDATLVMRIEDTDQERSTRANETMLLEDVYALGLTYDEGPDLGGPHVPYRQSERLKTYGEHALKLLKEGKAYYCFCSADLITAKREAALKLGKVPLYDGTCARIPLAEAEARVKKGEKAGLRFRAPQKTYILEDVVRGHVEFPPGMVGDFFITRSPTDKETEVAAGIGMPVYNFSCVIDDALMKITHVIRGEDHLSNTARQLMIYEAFGWKTPVFAHTAMVLGGDKQKLSKRNGDVSARDYLEKGYLPEALLNFLALLGWWPPKDFKPVSGHPEVLSLDELKKVFDTGGLHKAPAVFDVQKLQWMNAFYIRALSVPEVAKRARPFFEKHATLGPKITALVNAKGEAVYEKVIELIRGEVSLLGEMPDRASFLFDSSPEVEPAALEALKQNPDVVQAFEAAWQDFKDETITEDTVKQVQEHVKNTTQKKGKSLFMPMRALVTGKEHGPELHRIFSILGRTEVLKRAAHVRQRASV